MRLDLVTGPATEPLSLAEAKAYRRVDASAEDELLTDLIVAARELFEEETGRQVITATWRLYLDAFPVRRIAIPKAPLISVTSVAYVDTAGSTQTWSSSEYTVVAPSGPFARCGMLYPAPGYSFPSTLCTPNAVTVTFTAGYGAAASDVPESVRSTIQSLVGDMYEERESFLAGTTVAENPATKRALMRYRLLAVA